MGCGQSKQKRLEEPAALGKIHNPSFFDSFLERYAFTDFQENEASSKPLEFEVLIDKI